MYSSFPLMTIIKSSLLNKAARWFNRRLCTWLITFVGTWSNQLYRIMIFGIVHQCPIDWFCVLISSIKVQYDKVWSGGPGNVGIMTTILWRIVVHWFNNSYKILQLLLALKFSSFIIGRKTNTYNFYLRIWILIYL